MTVATGRYILTASAEGYESDTEEAVVEENTIAGVNFTLTPVVELGIIFGSVEDEYGDPFQGVEVTIEGSDNYKDTTETDEDGDYVFYDLSAGKYTLIFEAKG